MKTDNKPNAVQSIVRAANILAVIGDGLHSITEIAGKCGLSNSTVHRLLQAMVESHLVIQDSIGHKYFIGDLIAHLVTRPQVSHEYLIACAREEMNKLAEDTGETVILMVMTGHNYQILHEIPSKFNLRVVGAGVSSLHPILMVGAAGKVLFSQLDNKSFEAALRNTQVSTTGKEKNPDKKTLKRQIKQIRKNGYAVSYESVITGAMSLAAPVKNYVLPTVVTIMAPKDRLKPNTKYTLEKLVRCAEQISYLIGDKTGSEG